MHTRSLGMNNYRSPLSGFLLICCCLFVSCSDNNADLKRYIYDVKTRPPNPIEPIPEFVIPPKFSYPENELRRNPFKPNVSEKPKLDISAPDMHRSKQPLEAFSIDVLKFVGVLQEGSVFWGLINQPNGLVTKVKVGDYMGKNYGRVTNINDTSIALEEVIQVNGQWQKRNYMIKLSEK
ncbi:MAG: pilus assembly protein PilP [Legionella sp.]